MRNIWMLAKANLRKSKSQTIGMIVLMLMAVMFMNIGLVMFFGTGRFFDERAEQLNAPHFISMVSENAPSNAQKDFIRHFPGVTEVESSEVLIGMGNMFNADDLAEFMLVVLSPLDSGQQMNPPLTVGESLPFTRYSMYMSHGNVLSGGHEIGGNVKIEFMGTELNFTLAGGVEDILFGGLMENPRRFYLSEEIFGELQEQFPTARATMISARMENKSDVVFLYTEYVSRFFGTAYSELPSMGGFAMSYPFTYQTSREQTILVPLVVAAFMAAFSIILLVIGIIVVRFRISTSIDESMVNIGTLKAVGYRNHQIILSILLQFGLAVLVGGIIGVTLAQAALPILTQIAEPMLGLPWTPQFEPLTALFSLGGTLMLVLAFSLQSSWRINNLYTMAALKGGITTHSFKKNPMPLDKSRFPLPFVLALKQLFQNKKQAFMIFLIITGVSFVSVTATTTYYNLAVNVDTFMGLLGGDFLASDVMVMIDGAENNPEFIARMENLPQVDKIFSKQNMGLSIDGIVVFTYIVEDFSFSSGNNLIDGRFPIHDNEIVLGLPALTAMGKSMGDWVTIRHDETEREFMVTGIIQEASFNGVVGELCINAVSRVMPDFVFTDFIIDFVYGTDEAEFLAAMHETAGEFIIAVMSVQDQIDAIVNMVGGIFSIVTVLILAVVIAVVVMVLYLVIKTTILRKKRDLGIQKALGFTTLQLMNQIALNLSPSIFAGAAIGAVAGYFAFNPIFSTVMRGMGIIRVNMPVPANWTLIICAALLVLAYTVSMLIAWRIRKISAYALVTE